MVDISSNIIIDNVLNKVMDKPKTNCNCWLNVGSCYCEED